MDIVCLSETYIDFSDPIDDDCLQIYGYNCYSWSPLEFWYTKKNFYR